MTEQFPTDNSQYPDFNVGNLATDLVQLTLDLCNTGENKNPRFPRKLKDSYVTQVVNLSLTIHESVCKANAFKTNPYKRRQEQEEALGKCISMEKLIFIALKRGWISKKQHSRWQSLICGLHYKILKWMS